MSEAAGGAPGLQLEVVVAIARNGLIGRDNALPWHHPEDLAHFKALTSGHTLLMGRHTWESLGRPLPKRRHLIVSRREGRDPDGDERPAGDPAKGRTVRWFASAHAAVDWFAAQRAAGVIPADERLFVIGGGQLYGDLLRDEALRPAVLHVTWVPEVPLREGDVLFPVDAAWIDGHYDAEQRCPGEDGALEFVTYRLRDPAG